MGLSRRDLLAKCVSLGVVSLATNLSATAAAEAWSQSEKKSRPSTPAAETGPFYKRNAPNTAMMRASNDPGLPLTVDGAVYSTRGEILPGAKVEVWQTDHSGHYDLLGYRYRALLLADAKGRYGFSSVIPGHYPARVCQHIHFAVTAEGYKATGDANVLRERSGIRKGDPDKNYIKDPLCTSRESAAAGNAQGRSSGSNCSSEFRACIGAAMRLRVSGLATFLMLTVFARGQALHSGAKFAYAGCY